MAIELLAQSTKTNNPNRDLESARVRVAQIVSVSGSQAIALLDRAAPKRDQFDEKRIEMGALMKIRTPECFVVGVVSAISCPIPESDADPQNQIMIELNLAGEIPIGGRNQKLAFNRGLTSLPSVGDAVYLTSRNDLELVYSQPGAATIDVGKLYLNSGVSARLLMDDLFGKHFIVVGTTGCGKSSAVCCILQSALQEHRSAHIVVLDIHNEYSTAFGGMAELIDPTNLHLPYWLMNFNELTVALTTDDVHRDAEVEILGEAVLASKKRYAGAQSRRLRESSGAIGITVDTPTPFRLSDITAFIDERLGRLEKTQSVIPLRRLRNRIDMLVGDPRYGFMFANMVVEDTMSAILGRLFRVPIDGRPVTVINLATVPAEILDIVISVVSRLAFDLGVWSEGAIPTLLVCEEAHRYAPSANDGKFMPTRKALARIAKEGRKYGISLALVTQRPSELDQTILSQCSTVIAMRLATDRDQQVIRANTNEGALDLLDFLPLLGEREAIILGQGVIMPMRIKFRDIGSAKCKTSAYRSFSSAWKEPQINGEVLDDIVRSWRRARRPEHSAQTGSQATADNIPPVIG
jgi:DNA helicase HerA-like ATPase